MGEEKRGPTLDEVRRDSIASPQTPVGEEGISIGRTESTKRQLDGEPVEAREPTHPDVAGGTLDGELMGPDERIDGEGEGPTEPLREEDVTEEDALDDDVREGEEPVAIGAPLPGGAQGEDMLPQDRIDGEGEGPVYAEDDPRSEYERGAA